MNYLSACLYLLHIQGKQGNFRYKHSVWVFVLLFAMLKNCYITHIMQCKTMSTEPWFFIFTYIVVFRQFK